MAAARAPSDLSERLANLVDRGRSLEAEGLPFPTEQIRAAVETAVQQGALEQAASLLKRGESLYTVSARDWGWVRETLTRADELKAVASRIGLDVPHLDSRVGDPRAQLRSQSLSAASLGRAAASASLAVAVLHDAIPKYCLQESQKLGETIRSARNRGEEVTDSVRNFSRLLQAIQDGHLVQTANLLLEVRRSVARIPRAPSISVPSEEEEEILMEARNLARRLNRMKSKARNAQSAARLMTQVRAALSEERRYGTPEEEIEALWSEVDRLTQERAGVPGGPAEPTTDASDDDLGDETGADDEEELPGEAAEAPILPPPRTVRTPRP